MSTDRPANGAMSSAEREDLAKLVRRREKLAKGDTDRVAAERLAQFEQQLASIYKPNDDPVWEEATRAAKTAEAEASAAIISRCDELGIPEECRPAIELRWYGRGATAAAQRRAELRKAAQVRVAADVKAAKVQIERRSIEVQEELIAGGLQSEEARAFLESMPAAEALMPPPPAVAELTKRGRLT